MYPAEAEGLEALRAAANDDVLIPVVMSVDDAHITMERIGTRAGGAFGGDPAARLGRGLAHIHRSTHAAFGWGADNWIGLLPQRNAWVHGSAAEFFATRRLMPQVEMAAGRGCLPAGTAARVERVCARLGELLPDEPPALLHGDLWGGNWQADDRGRAWLFDPAVAYGSREQDLAFTSLFGGFPPSFLAAYQEAWPLAPGFARRVDLWNLYPLLVHANLFGGGYGRQVDRVARGFE